MEKSDDFSLITTNGRGLNDIQSYEEIPIANVQVVAVDFDNTLAEYNPERFSENKVGKPRKNAIWALENFKYNNCEVEIFTRRKNLKPVWYWVKRFANGLIDRINEGRNSEGRNNIHKYVKPDADLFIDDKSEYWYNKDLDWVEVMLRLYQRGFLSYGLFDIPDLEDELMFERCTHDSLQELVTDIKTSLEHDRESINGILSDLSRYVREISTMAVKDNVDRLERARASGRLLENVLKIMTYQGFDPVGCVILSQQDRVKDEVLEMSKDGFRK